MEIELIQSASWPNFSIYNYKVCSIKKTKVTILVATCFFFIRIRTLHEVRQ